MLAKTPVQNISAMLAISGVVNRNIHWLWPFIT